MLRTQISLSEQQRLAIDVESRRTGRSMAELIRLAIDEMFLKDLGRDDDVRAIHEAAGAWSRRPDEEDLDGAAYVDRLRSGHRLRG